MKYVAPFLLNGALILIGVLYSACSSSELAGVIALFIGLPLGAIVNIGMATKKFKNHEMALGCLYLVLFIGIIVLFKMLGSFPLIGYHNP